MLGHKFQGLLVKVRNELTHVDGFHAVGLGHVSAGGQLPWMRMATILGAQLTCNSFLMMNTNTLDRIEDDDLRYILKLRS